MKKQKRWQFILIAVVVLLTFYNILPTVLFYSKPLNEAIGEKQATAIAEDAAIRVNALEDEALGWLKSYNKLLGIKASSIALDSDNPELIHIRYEKEEDAKILRKHLPRAGSLIPFVPAQLSLIESSQELDGKAVTVQRKVPIHFYPNEVEKTFQFTKKRDSQGNIAPFYHQIVNDRLLQIGLAVGGISENAQYLDTALHHLHNSRSEEFLQLLTQNILSYAKVFGENSPIAKRYYATFTQNLIENKKGAIDQLISTLETYRDQIKLQRIALEEADVKKRGAGSFLEANEQQQLDFLKGKEERVSSALGIVRRQATAFASGATPWTSTKLKQNLPSMKGEIQSISVQDRSPLVKAITIDWNNETIHLEVHQDVLDYKKEIARSKSYLSDPLDQLVFNEIARIGREAGEQLNPKGNTFAIELNHLTNSESLLVMDLSSIAQKQGEQLLHLIKTKWLPTHADLKSQSFPVYDYETFKKLPPHQQKIGLVVYTPAESEGEPLSGFRKSSVYVIAKGIQDVLNKLSENPDSPQAKSFINDFNHLRLLLQNNGFSGYPGATYPLSGSFSKDFIFEAEDFYSAIISATREDFKVHGTRKFATLEFTNVEQRILALNKIETKEHEDLLRWRDEYQSAQARPELHAKYDIPKPIKNPLWSNLALSARKYFRGDERKILHWGLDLSGGKTVQIQLRDSNNKVVTNDADIKQGIDELYGRVNKMGVSEVTIRQEGSNITLDFPSAQGLSAADLVKASSMYFHIVNEKFTNNNGDLAPAVHQFLQDVWNEAVVTNRKDIESINQIAWKHLYGDTMDVEMAQPVSEAAKTLYSQGLRLSSPQDQGSSSQFNDSISKIAIYRGDNYADWHGQTHPLLIVMNNYALEGANLTDVHAAYDPTKGNFLAFNVKGTQLLSDGQKLNPRNELYNWTAPFSKEKVQGTPLD
ncbi:MAG: protein translocase subunit SecDF, partial [Chlamydiia bacterium]|nr:protein translocase subunit SecDF [Chlamydiia bacterium]